MRVTGNDESRGSGDPADRARALEIVVSAHGAAVTHALPPRGAVTLGRAADNDIVVDEWSVSRHHARLHLAPALAIEDLGSANGTYVRGDPAGAPRTARLRDLRLKPGQRAPLAPGATFALGSVELAVRYAAAVGAADETVEADDVPRRVVVRDAAMRRLHQLARRVADAPMCVLLLGETGVGKEVLAEAIHAASARAARPMLRINCAALPEHLLESELFGHEKGAFSGAVAAKPGLFETAHGGTVLLDEVGDLPAATQVKLLRVIEDRCFFRVGGVAPLEVDVRFLAATHRDLEAEVARGTFRRDLYFRLNGLTLTIPPLRARPAELVELAELFAANAARKMRRARAAVFSPAALAAMREHAWPGNVRELRNVVERAVALCADGGAIGPEHLELVAPRRAPSPSGVVPRAGEGAASERERIVAALAQCAGNQSHAAQLLGISRRTLVSRLTAYGLPRPRKPSRGR